MFLLIRIIIFTLLFSLQAQAATQATTPNSETTDAQRLSKVIANIHKYYIRKVDNKELYDNAIKGMVKKLDPHSAYLGGEELANLHILANGSFDGIGISVLPENGALKVITPIDGSPAQKAGIKSGDLIVRINNSSVKNIGPNKAIQITRGKRGTKVTIYVIRQNVSKLLKFTLTRKKINTPSVYSKIYDKHYGYIRIALFQETTPILLKKAIAELQRKADNKLFGLIIDIRNNPGGLLKSAVDSTDLFLNASRLTENNLIVYIKGQSSNKQINYLATNQHLASDVPIIILINEGTASAAEILAGALQDHKRAIIIGTKSFGKGSVQTVVPIDEKSALKLTTALYYTPKNRSIQAQGIVPNIVVTNLRIQKNNPQQMKPLREINLRAHIKNGHAENSASPNKSHDSALAYNDFQLFQAVTLLKGIHHSDKK